MNASTRKISICGRHTQYSLIHPDRVMNEHDLIYCISGSWEIWQNEKQYMLHSGESLLLSAAMHHYGIQRSSADCETIFIHFSAEEDDALDLDCCIHPTPIANQFIIPVLNHSSQSSIVYDLFCQIVDAFWSPTVYASIEAEAYLTLLLAHITKSCSQVQEKHVGKNDLINKILLMLDVNEDRFYSNEELAEVINVHPRTLHNYFVEIVGMPVHRYQIQTHLAKAHKLLSADSSLPLSVVAERFGFCDEYHFSKYYKRQFGFSPKKRERKKED